jgi:hypothetical protein
MLSAEVGALSAQLTKMQKANISTKTSKTIAEEQALSNQINEKQTIANKKLLDIEAKEAKIAHRVQGGKIVVNDPNYFTSMGINIAPITYTGVAAPNTKKLTALEKLVGDRETQQKSLIAELKVIQDERITEQANARVNQINELVRKRAVNRRDASKMKLNVAKETNAQRAAIKGVDDSIPLPDITVFDEDLRSEAQQILDSTGGVVKGIKKSTAAGKLRQVTRSRKPQTAVTGIQSRGATVPRPREEFPNRSTTLGSQNTIVRNPFLDN